MARVGAIAERYADALFQAALSEGVLLPVLSDSQYLRQIFNTDKILNNIIQSRLIPREQFLAAFSEIKNNIAIHKITGHFMCVIAENRRQNLLLDIFKLFENKVNKHQGKKDVYVTSVHPLSEEQRKRLISVLEKRTQAKIFLHEKTDAELIGGLVIRVGSFEMDSSIRAKLQCIQQSLESLK